MALHCFIVVLYFVSAELSNSLRILLEVLEGAMRNVSLAQRFVELEESLFSNDIKVITASNHQQARSINSDIGAQAQTRTRPVPRYIDKYLDPSICMFAPVNEAKRDCSSAISTCKY